jgi:cytochrome c oxidase subunit II
MADITDASPPAAGGQAVHGAGPSERHHFRWIIGIWAVLAVAADLIFWFVGARRMPPGNMTATAGGQQFDFSVLAMMGIPVVLGVLTYTGYALTTWRASLGGPEPVTASYSRGHLGIQIAWIAVSTGIVLGAFGFGLYELVQPGGAGGGQGPSPAWPAPSKQSVLPIQVIAQQWRFTYRYPTYGGFETTDLVIPANTWIAFHVTSLDVIHSFWAYQLGVKADANPGYDNIAYTKTTAQLGNFTVRCAELCGIWHGAMFDTGHVIGASAFDAWARATETRLAAATKLLPPFAWTYIPDANGADGGYYPDNEDPYSPVETYGAQKVTP